MKDKENFVLICQLNVLHRLCLKWCYSLPYTCGRFALIRLNFSVWRLNKQMFCSFFWIVIFISIFCHCGFAGYVYACCVPLCSSWYFKQKAKGFRSLSSTAVIGSDETPSEELPPHLCANMEHSAVHFHKVTKMNNVNNHCGKCTKADPLPRN